MPLDERMLRILRTQKIVQTYRGGRTAGGILFVPIMLYVVAVGATVPGAVGTFVIFLFAVLTVTAWFSACVVLWPRRVNLMLAGVLVTVLEIAGAVVYRLLRFSMIYEDRSAEGFTGWGGTFLDVSVLLGTAGLILVIGLRAVRVQKDLVAAVNASPDGPSL